jgi:SagB-type dehydrogenase family enzyme
MHILKHKGLLRTLFILLNMKISTSYSGLRESIDQVIKYHKETKHFFNRYSRSLGYMDWASQPNPFRRYDGASLLSLPLLSPNDVPRSPTYDSLYERSVAPVPISIASVSRFFELSLGITAWKQAGKSKRALRSNPSSGNLHPTEGYVILPEIESWQSGLYHYAPREHGLEHRAEIPEAIVRELLQSFPRNSFLLGFTSIHWREAWKYGERAFRYCNHDVGHALASARIAAASLGWKVVILDGMDQGSVGQLLGTNRVQDYPNESERDHPDCLAVVWYEEDRTTTHSDPPTIISSNIDIPLHLNLSVISEMQRTVVWHGVANGLSASPPQVHWDIIDEVAHAAWKSNTQTDLHNLFVSPSDGGIQAHDPNENCPAGESHLAADIIRQRRSAVSFDSHSSSISFDHFLKILYRVLPIDESTQRKVPWDVWPQQYDTAIHLVFFVHHVEGLAPGMYFLLRDSAKLPYIRECFGDNLLWERVQNIPSDIHLYVLKLGPVMKLATRLSCTQDIAGDGAFSLGMIADFDKTIGNSDTSYSNSGSWRYPRLFWEAGILGQVLYLEAESVGLRATGIGCFFDDPVHAELGIRGTSFQSLYHLAIGKHVDDHRIMTLPPYDHLKHGKK